MMEKGNIGTISYILIAVIAAVVLVSVFILFLRPEKPTEVVCGDKACDKTENCYDCPKDCKCKSDEYCPEKTKKCTKPVCGNGKCEPFEIPENCCDDCSCTIAGEVCNKETHTCESEIQISDERVKELVTEYFEGQGKKVSIIERVYPGAYKGKSGKYCALRLEEDKDVRAHLVLVTEEEKIIEIPIY
jgi:hypothetical protein